MAGPIRLFLYGGVLLLVLLVSPGNGATSRKTKTDDLEGFIVPNESIEDSDEDAYDDLVEGTKKITIASKAKKAAKSGQETSQKPKANKAKSTGKENVKPAHTPPIPAGYTVTYVPADGMMRPRLRGSDGKVPAALPEGLTEWQFYGRGFSRTVIPTYEAALKKKGSKNQPETITAHVPPIPEGFKVVEEVSDGIVRPRLRPKRGWMPKHLPEEITEWQIIVKDSKRTIIPTYEAVENGDEAQNKQTRPVKVKGTPSTEVSDSSKPSKPPTPVTDDEGSFCSRDGTCSDIDNDDDDDDETGFNRGKDIPEPDFWKKTPLTSWNSVWWRVPENGFKFLEASRPSSPCRSRSTSPSKSPGRSNSKSPTRSPSGKSVCPTPSDEKIPDVLYGRNLSIPQIFEVDGETVSGFFKDAGTGNDVPSKMGDGCIIEVCRLSHQNSPILLVGDRILQPIGWFNQTSKRTTGAFFVENNQEVRRYCPGDYYKMSSYKCKKGNLYKDNRIVQDSDLVCKENYVPHVFYHDQPCNEDDPDSAALYSGYVIPSASDPEQAFYYPLVHICWQKQSAMPYWTKIKMHGRNTRGKCSQRTGDFVVPPKGIYASGITTSFSPANKKAAYENFLGTRAAFDWFSGVDRGHFTAYMDAPYYPWQLLTNEYMNQAPQHAAVNRGNHMYLEKEVRDVISSMKTRMYVVTGPIGYIQKKDIPMKTLFPKMSSSEIATYKKISDNAILELNFKSQQLPFNKFYYKILYQDTEHKGIVLISSNIPMVHKVEKLCKDVCNEYGWLKSMNRFNFTIGFAYCCEVPEFLNKFPYIAESLQTEKTKDLAQVKPLLFKGKVRN